jgi:capsular polysaccharide transport system ATP-binding protein
MIVVDSVTKIYKLRRFEKRVFEDLSLVVPRGTSLGICGANGAGKSTLMRLMAGVEAPTRGSIRRSFTCSWPIGYTSCFQASLTGADNARFIARIYNQPIENLLGYVEDFAELGAYFHQPLYSYSAGMIARLAFGISLAINFDCYLIDEVTSAGDQRFRVRCEEALHRKRTDATLVMISHDPTTLKEYCSAGAVLNNGRISLYDTIDEAIEVHSENQSMPIAAE